MQIDYSAPQPVRDAVAALGRTEDVRFSPGNRRLAVACFLRHRVTLFGIEVIASPDGPRVSLTSALELSSPAFKKPHGLDFIDDETLIVANREGDVAIFKLPADEPGVRSLEVFPIQTWRADELDLLSSPGSVSVADVSADQCEIIVCNNYVHTVTRHVLDLRADSALTSSEVLLEKWLHIPDGVSVSPDRRWIAVSNHETHGVMLYDNVPSLNAQSDPIGILRGTSFPHGLRFSADGGYLFVADAGAPSVHIYQQDAGGWCGVRRPHATVRVMSQEMFVLGQVNPEEGGPKGIDINSASSVLVATTEFLPLAFFDLPAIIAQGNVEAAEQEAAVDTSVDQLPAALSAEAGRTLEIARELRVMELEVRAQRAEAELALLQGSLSWRITTPVRRLRSLARWRREVS